MTSNDVVIGGRAFRPYVVSADRALLAAAEAQGAYVQDAFGARGERWFQALRELDEALFSATGQALPAWVFYDCAMAPGVVVGLAAQHESPLSAEEQGLRPVTLGIAIPTAAPGTQLVHTLAALSLDTPDASEQALSATWVLLRAIAASGGGGQDLIVTAPWAGALVSLMARERAEVLAAHMPSHDAPETATFGVGPSFSSAGVAAEVQVLQRGDAGSLIALQRVIEGGARAWLQASATQAVQIRVASNAAPANEVRDER